MGEQDRSRGRNALPLLVPVLLGACTAQGGGPVAPVRAVQFSATQCEALASAAVSSSPVSGLVVSTARWQSAGLIVDMRGTPSAPLPAHCLVEGHYGEREGTVGGPYRTGFRMRLPADWNGRFFFNGGGGSNGVVADASGFNGVGNRTALERGYAVIAQDSGHDNTRNNVAEFGGNLVFGHDPLARADYGHASLKPTYDLARHLIRRAYGRDATTKVFWGCSKGGQEGMAFAQRYPDAFDGIVAAAPGFALPRAAVAEAWDIQQFSGILRARGETPSLAGLKTAFSPAQSKLVGEAILAACDAGDGAADGIVSAAGLCTTAKVLPELRQRQCTPGAVGECLEPAQVDALVRVVDGARDSRGTQLYKPFPWDPGIASPGWAVWKTGLVNGPPALNAVLGAGSLAAVFTAPPTALGSDPERLLAWQLAFDFDRDAPKIYATSGPFKTSAWQDIGMRSPDLAAFRAHGGKLIVPHGMADPVFSASDTIAWWNEVDARNRGRAADFARVFPVPGMNHCGGGPATDQFDSLSALEDWVLHAKAPAEMPAKAGPATPWPGRQRPLCAYPTYAVPGPGGFVCRR